MRESPEAVSVTIYPTQPGTLRPFPSVGRRVPCDACARGYCQPGWCEDGVEIVREPTAPEVNYANTNARALLTALGLDAGEYLCGAIDAAEVAGAIAECEAALVPNAGGFVARSGMLREHSRSPGLVVEGSTDARALERLGELREVLLWALAQGAGLAWG